MREGTKKKKPLIIVESPTKAKTISRFMKSRYEVKASLGHVRDLPKSRLGVDIENDFAPQYINIRGKGPLIKDLKSAAKNASKVYLATDPDREGEAISWHLCTILGIDPDKAQRVAFHEITDRAVKDAFKHPKPIDTNLVNAQQARRVLDRLVGYSLSPVLWHKIRPGLSAGRVQSAALRLIVDRDNEIDAFIPQEYWTIEAHLQGKEGSVKAKYYGENGKKKELPTRASVDEILAQVQDKPFAVESVTPKQRKRLPPLPFTTSTLQQEASRKLGFAVRRTMSVAQSLYEGVELGKEGYVGLITYMRTDSTRISPEAEKEGIDYITTAFTEEYVGSHRRPRNRPGIQGAHEAIRPTSVWRTPDQLKAFLKQDQYRLYRLIWLRFVASLMAPAIYDTVTCDIKCGIQIFRTTGNRVRFPGFTKLYEESSDTTTEPEEHEIIPLTVGESLELLTITPEQHFTEPPPSYTEASLVKALEENGIGRPSTYAPIIATLFAREYIKRQAKRIFASDLGKLVDQLLRENFPSIVDLQFTAEMEKKLDSVEEGQEDWKVIVKDYWLPLKELIDKAEEELGKYQLADEPAGEDCEKCGRPMVIKRGRYGKFLACSGYPDCKNTKPFLAKTGVKCPRCQGDLVARRSKRGRTFYGCASYPDCDFVIWNRPIPDSKCPMCGTFLVETGGRSKTAKCANSDCSYKHKL
jgi:DNA topoisomerase-1